MIKANMKAAISNRGVTEIGTIIRKWKRKGTTYYNVQMERGYLMENLTDDVDKPCYILIKLTEQINSK